MSVQKLSNSYNLSLRLSSSLRYFSLLFLLFLLTNSFAQTFEYRGNTIEQWDILDLRGDAEVNPTIDKTCPPGFGPEVLHIEGSVVLGMVKGLQLSAGTFVALYHENEPNDQDADGIIMIKAEYDKDISVVHNTKEELPHVWLEQDNDCGLQIRSYIAGGREETIVERGGVAVITDPWNRTNWIWQKVKIEGNVLRAKTWPAHGCEPQEWAIECKYNGTGERFGFKVNSGNINLAYLAADAKDIHIEYPKAFLYAPVMKITKTKKIDFILFTNEQFSTSKDLYIKVSSEDNTIAESSFSIKASKGSSEFPFFLTNEPGVISNSKSGVFIQKEIKEGPLDVVIYDNDLNLIAERTVMVLPVKRIQKRFIELSKILDLISNSLEKGEKISNAYKTIKVIRDAAKVHLERAIALFDEGDMDRSEMSLRFVDEALGELAGFKGEFISRLNPAMNLSIAPWNESDKRGVGTKPENGLTDAYSMKYLLSFGEPIITAQSMVMGLTYDLTIPWKVDGVSPDKDYKFIIRVVSPLGERVVAKTLKGPDVRTSLWKPGETYLQHVQLSISPEDPEKGKGQPEQPSVLDEYHYILISVIDPATEARLLLGNAPGPQPHRVGQSFSAGEVFISSTPIEIRNLSFCKGEAGIMRKDSFAISNVGNENIDADVLFSVRTNSGQIVYQNYKSISLLTNESIPVQFNWTPKWAGDLEIKIQLVNNGITLTEAIRKISVELPKGFEVKIVKENHVRKLNGNFYTPILVECGDKKADVEVYAGDRLVGAAEGINSINVNTEPWFGYYDIVVKIGQYIFAKRIIATVVEIDGMDLIVNGEPFLVKGVNVHGLDGVSPEKSASMLRIMRELGFNSWRGDYPPLWQIELAYKLNSFYSVLGPFSCTGTDEVFARQAGPPMTTARELSRLFVERYKNSAGVLLWNSCNEIVGEKEDFLNTLQPVFKTYDPYNRPVHYSNLFGQNLNQGQDMMGVNYYFGSSQSAKDRQPLIQRSIDIARNNNMPVMYNEFNSFAGAVHSKGVEAMYDMFEWGIEQGMCGGFQYMKGNSTSHPGIFDSGYNTHKIYNEAIIDVLADAEVKLNSAEIQEGKVNIQVKNKRRFTLRQISVTLTASGNMLEPLVLSDMAPESVQNLIVSLPKTVIGEAVTLEGHIEFVTHYGFKCNVPILLIAKHANEK
jgi:hypothetical protein